MASLDEALDEWLKQVGKVANMSYSDQAKITSAGAEVMADKYREATEAKHPNVGKPGKYGHLSDDISSQSKNVDGELDGTSTAGFTQKEFVARFLNDGTKFIQGDHFVDDARAAAQTEVLKAEAEEYKKLINKLGG